MSLQGLSSLGGAEEDKAEKVINTYETIVLGERGRPHEDTEPGEFVLEGGL